MRPISAKVRIARSPTLDPMVVAAVLRMRSLTKIVQFQMKMTRLRISTAFLYGHGLVAGREAGVFLVLRTS